MIRSLTRKFLRQGYNASIDEWIGIVQAIVLSPMMRPSHPSRGVGSAGISRLLL